jgi:hypothetical protein
MRRSSLILLAAMLAGCNETILIPPGTVVRLAAPTPAKVATFDRAQNAWIVQAHAVTLPEGYYVVPPPESTTKP